MELWKYPEDCIFHYWFPIRQSLRVFWDKEMASQIEQVFQKKVILCFQFQQFQHSRPQCQKLYPDTPICSLLE